MDKKVTGILSYCTIIGWIVAFVAGDKEGAKLHINQGLVIAVLELGLGIVGAILGLIPFIGVIFGFIVGLLELGLLALVILGIYYAATGEDKAFPFIGDIKIFN